MKRLNKTCIFYHGLGGEPISWIKEMMNEKGFYVVQDHIDFYKEWFKDKGKSLMEKQFKKAEKADLIMGLSFGGHPAYLSAKHASTNLLLINPAVNRKRSTVGIGYYKAPVNDNKIDIEVYFGQFDQVVPKAYTQEFFHNTGEEYNAWIINRMQHGISNLDYKVIIEHSPIIKKLCEEI
jgi:hypothetical protein